MVDNVYCSASIADGVAGAVDGADDGFVCVVLCVWIICGCTGSDVLEEEFRSALAFSNACNPVRPVGDN